jgi:hypothetical protein
MSGIGNYRHGHRGVGSQHSSTYRTWDKMKARCNNPSELNYYLYGGRGIKVCERWMIFKNFLDDMGEKPKGRSLDRIDGNGDYKPGNCRWATPAEQNANRVTHDMSKHRKARARASAHRMTNKRRAKMG